MSCCLRFFEGCVPRDDIGNELEPSTRHQTSLDTNASVLKHPILVYVSIDSLHELMKEFRLLDMASLDSALHLYRELARSIATHYRGYEVHHHLGNHAFLLAFPNITLATKFALLCQHKLVHAPWQDSFLSTVAAVREEREELSKEEGEAEVSPEDSRMTKSEKGQVLFRGLRVRMGIHVAQALVCRDFEAECRNPHVYLKIGPDMTFTKLVGVHAHGGQIILSAHAWADLKDQLIQVGNPVVEDLGVHVLTKDTPSLQLMQILPSSLAQRQFPPLCSLTQVRPGMRDAPPCARHTEVTMVFSYIHGLRQMILTDAQKAVSSIDIFCEIARTLVGEFGGYECQELQGEFMLAFHDPVAALLWAGGVQREMAKARFDMGIELAIGIETGEPTSVTPHCTTGRADYFGQIVNQTARIAKSAQDGQILLGPRAWTRIEEHQYPTLSLDTLSVEDKSSSTPFVFYYLGEYQYKGLDESTSIVEARNLDQVHKVFPQIKATLDRRAPTAQTQAPAGAGDSHEIQCQAVEFEPQSCLTIRDSLSMDQRSFRLYGQSSKISESEMRTRVLKEVEDLSDIEIDVNT